VDKWEPSTDPKRNPDELETTWTVRLDNASGHEAVGHNDHQIPEVPEQTNNW